MREPGPEETLTPFMFAPMLAGFLANRRIKLPGPRLWLLNFGASTDYAVRFDGRHWDWQKAESPGEFDVRITTTPKPGPPSSPSRANNAVPPSPQ